MGKEAPLCLFCCCLFVVHLTRILADVVRLLQGMLCTISSACESLSKWEKHQSAVHVVGPLGLAKFLETALRISKTFISVPVVVHELVEEAVPEEVSRRSPHDAQTGSLLYCRHLQTLQSPCKSARGLA